MAPVEGPTGAVVGMRCLACAAQLGVASSSAWKHLTCCQLASQDIKKVAAEKVKKKEAKKLETTPGQRTMAQFLQGPLTSKAKSASAQVLEEFFLHCYVPLNLVGSFTFTCCPLHGFW